jgi:hypothetical protein
LFASVTLCTFPSKRNAAERVSRVLTTTLPVMDMSWALKASRALPLSSKMLLVMRMLD